MKNCEFNFSSKTATVLLALSFMFTNHQAQAGAGWGVSTNATGAPIMVPTYNANSPSGLRPDLSPTAKAGAMVNTGKALRKFVDTLPGLGATGANNLGQYLPVAVPDTTTYPGSDYYEIGIVEYTEKMHSDLPKATTLRGYVQLETASNAATSKHVALTYPNGTPILNSTGQQVFAVDKPHYLGPIINAKHGVPVRFKFSNLLPTGHYDPITKSRGGDLFLPVDKTLPGAGLGPDGIHTYTENRALIHLHGGDTPWISDGTPHQWITPAGENTPYTKGASFQNVPDMPDPGPGAGTLYFPNNQSARMMFFHDHTVGITRLNVYAGEVAGYFLSDIAEQGLITSGAIPADQIPLIIQDKTFVPADISQQDAKWDVNHWGQPGDLWFSHVYETNQDPNSFDGTNPVGRWDYGPWFWPVFPAPLPLPTGEYGNVSLTPETFMDTPVVNGTAYPTVTVQPKAYRFRILNGSNDRSLNLGLYEAEPLSVVVTSGGTGYSATPTVTITPVAGDVTGNGATATAVVTAGVVTQIVVTNPGKGYTAAPTIKITDATGIGATAVSSLGTEVKMVPAVPTAGWPATWPTDAREGGVPDPATAGPDVVQIGSEGGFLPAPAVIPSTPIGYEYNRRSATVLNVMTFGLYLAPAERADAVIDFSGYCPGTKLIMYNDAPAPVPGFDPRIDYYTGAPDQSSVGGAASTLPGYGPNTRTVMQFVIAGTPVPGCVRAAFTQSAIPTVKNPTLTTLQTALPSAYAASQPKPVVGESIYNGMWGTTTFNDTFAGIHTGSLQQPNFTFVNGDGVAETLPVQNKAIQELFDPSYGRMNATLGVEMPFTSAFNQTTIPLGFVDPATETITDGGTQIWKITHNGVDTHPVHFHLVNVQLINRVGWDGTVKPPAENEMGWKETVKMNPLEDVIVAVRSKAPPLPFGLPESVRALDPSQPLGVTTGFSQVDPNTGFPALVTNIIANFGWEYVWHCHILGHEENDFMRPIIFKYTAIAPLAPTNVSVNAGVVNWTDTTPGNAAATMFDQQNEIGFRIERSANYGAFAQIGTALANATSFVDTTPRQAGTDYSYRVIAFNAAGNSPASNSATLVQLPGGLTPGSVTFASQAVGTISAPQTLSLTNATATAMSIMSRTISGLNAADFAETDNCGTSLASAATCTINVTFSPLTSGSAAAMITVGTSAGLKTASLSGASPAPSATVMPATPLTFAAQQVGTTGAILTATLSNTGTAPLSVSGISIGGTNAVDFTQTNTCGTSLPAAGTAGSSCTISVTFKPSLVSLETATMSVVTNAGTKQVVLNGQGVAPSVTMNPTAPLQLAFAPQQIGTVSAPSTATLTNSGLGPVTISSVTITGLNQIDFAQTNTCGMLPATLAAGASCAINVTFKPTVASPLMATLNVVTSAGTPTVALSGGGQAPSSTLTPATLLTYSLQQVNTTSVAQVATLTNTGVGPLTYTSVSITGANATDFAQTNNCATGLAAGATCPISVTFTPTAVGPRTATLNVVDPTGTQMLTLNGSGQAANSATVSAAGLSYAAQQTGTSSAAQGVTLTNTGALALPITSIAITGVNATDFTQTNNCGLSVAAGATGTCTINVTFTPAAAGAKSATLTIVDGAGTQTVALGGTGQAPSSTLAPATPLAFGTLQSGSPASAAQVATLTNTGVGPLSISSITISGTDAAEFAQTNTCGTLPSSLAVTGSCTVNVTFTPGVAGTKTATLTVVDVSGTKTVALSATSQAVSSTLTPTTPLTFAAQEAGTTSLSQVATLTNTGIGSLSISSIAISGTNAAEFAQSNTCGVLPGSLPAGASGNCAINVSFKPTTAGTKTATLSVVDGNGTQTIALNGTGAVQQNSLTPNTPLTFAAQQTGTTSPAQVLTLANSGIIPLTVSSIAISGPNAADFVQTNNCGTSLPVGVNGVCTINVTFKPATAGAKSATLTLVDGAATYTIALSGSGQAASLSVTPATPIAFATTQTGTASATQAVTLTNTGIGSVAISSITLTGSNASEFTQSSNCGASLAVGASGTCTINVAFAPTSAGAKSATLSVVDGAGTHTVALSGTGQVPSASLNPATSLSFAAQQTATTSAAQPVVLSNTGVGPLSIAGITFSGTNYLNFTQINNCGTSLAAGTSCTINVSFAPTATGAMTATLNVADGAGTHTIALSGTGAVPQLSLTPTTPLTFAVQQTGTSSTAQVATLTNTGALTLPISSIAISGVDAADFTQTNNCGSSLAVGVTGTCTINVTFKPATAGTKSATLTVVDGAGTQTVALNGTSQAPAGSLTPTTPFAFAAQQTGTSSVAQTATLNNTGVGPLAISSITISGANAADFAQTNTCGTLPASLAAGATGNCMIDVSFKPATIGTKSATLTVVDASGTHTLGLSGTGAVQQASLAPATPLTFGLQQTGTTSPAQVATLTNTSLLPLSVSSITISGANAADFAQTNNCGTSVAAGATGNCTINVTFAPGVVGTKTAVLTVVDGAGTHSINLNGTGATQTASLTPTTQLGFAPQESGTASAPLVATLTNTGSLPLSVGSITLTGANAADFAQANNCGTSVASGATGSCSISVTFKPVAAGIKTAALTVVDGAGTHTVALNGTGAVQMNSLTPTTPMAFALQQAGTTSPAQVATLTNSGIIPLSVTSIAISGTNAADFAQTNNCGTSLPVGATGTCSIYVTFAPATIGTKSATLTVVDGAGTHNIVLSGSGAVPQVSLTPTTPLTFAAQQIGTSSTAQVATLTNTGALALPISSIAITGANAADFTQTNNCGASLAAGANCTINVFLAPGSAGTKIASLSVVDGVGTQTVTLNGTSQAPAGSLTPTTPFAFAPQQTGTSSVAQTATLTNTGVGPLAISGITISGANAADFAQTNNCGTGLPVGAIGTCTINVTFAPAATGTKSATLTVVDASGSHSIALSGTGAVQQASLTSVKPLTFAAQQTGTSSTVQVATLTNPGLIPLSVSSIAISGVDAADFAQTNNCGTSVAAGAAGNCTISVAFKPATTGTKSATLTVVDGAGTHTLALSGTGAVQQASLTPTAPMTFATKQTGTSTAAQVATLTNPGIIPLSVSSITITGADAADFVQTNNCGTSLPVGASGTCAINVTFAPVTIGAKTATLTLVDGTGTHTIALTGQAVAQAAMLSPTSLVFASQQVGVTSAAQAVTLTNTGAGPLSISGIMIRTSGEVNQFAQQNDCGTSLAEGASCTISVTFGPSTVGTKLEMLMVGYAGGMQTLMLHGTAAAPKSTLTPGLPIAFGNQLLGTTSGLIPLTLTNDGVIPLSIASIAIESWGQLNQFVQTNNCGSSLAAGANCMIYVSFTPTTEGSKLATLTISDASGGHVVALSGTGVTPLTGVTTPASSLTPSLPFTFASQMVGVSSAPQVATLTNTGILPLLVTSISITGVDAGDFAQTNTCGVLPANLATGATGMCTIDVVFMPKTAGAKNATLTVVDTAGTHTITLTGTGL